MNYSLYCNAAITTGHKSILPRKLLPSIKRKWCLINNAAFRNILYIRVLIHQLSCGCRVILFVVFSENLFEVWYAVLDAMTILKKIWWEGVDCHLAQYRDQLQTQVIMVMNFQVHKRQEISWRSEWLLGSQEGYCSTNLFTYMVLSVITNNLYISFKNFIFFKVFTVIVPITCKQKFNKWHAMIMGNHRPPYSFLANIICICSNITFP